jgi:hypothetical protein
VGLFFGLFIAVEVAAHAARRRPRPALPRLRLIARGRRQLRAVPRAPAVPRRDPLAWALVLPVGLGGGLIFTLAIAYLQDLLAAARAPAARSWPCSASRPRGWG